MPTIKSVIVLSFLLLSPVLLRPQTADRGEQRGPAPERQTQQSQSGEASATQPDGAIQPKPEPPAPSQALVAAPVEKKKDDSEGKQTKRMFGIIPNFAAVSAGKELPPLTVRDKFWLATQDSVDYSSFIWAGMQAGQKAWL